MWKRAILASVVVAGTVVGVPPSGATPEVPAAVQAQGQWIVVAGNFSGDGRDESFWYLPGGIGDDALVSSGNGGVPNGRLDEQMYPFNVANTYKPLAGDFDGDGYDEIFWYAPGAAADSMWSWPANDFVHPVSKPMSMPGTYTTPLVGDFNGDRVDDILWYSPGTAPDRLWYFRPGGSHVSIPQTINRTYRPVVASIGKDATDDIVWYAPGSAPDTAWDFTYGTRTHTSLAITVNGAGYRPVGLDAHGQGPRGDDLWWYAPGNAGDPFWDYVDGVRASQQPVPLGSDWRAAVGDFFGDGRQDVYLTDTRVGYTLRDFTLYQGHEAWIDYSYRYTSASATSATAVSPGHGPGLTVEAGPPHFLD